MKKYKNYILLISALVVFAITACVSDDTDFSAIIAEREAFEVAAVELDYTDLDEAAEHFDADDNDYVENSSFDRVVSIAFEGNTVNVSGNTAGISISTNGAHVTITSGVKDVAYRLTGKTQDGGVKIYSDHRFMLSLGGVEINNSSGAAINSQCGKTMYVVLEAGTTNLLTDGTAYNTPAWEDEKGALFSEGQIVFSGAGTLNVEGNCRHGIASDDYIVFRPGSKFHVTSSAGHAIKANDGIAIRGSVLNVEATRNAGKGINSEGFVEVTGGRTTIITTGDGIVEGNDTSSCAAVKCDSTFTMTAGQLYMKSTGMGGKGINATQSIRISGGTVKAVTLGAKDIGSPKAIKSDEDIVISGGNIYSYSASAKPLDAAGTLTVSPGWTTYSSGERLVVIAY